MLLMVQADSKASWAVILSVHSTRTEGWLSIVTITCAASSLIKTPLEKELVNGRQQPFQGNASVGTGGVLLGELIGEGIVA